MQQLIEVQVAWDWIITGLDTCMPCHIQKANRQLFVCVYTMSVRVCARTRSVYHDIRAEVVDTAGVAGLLQVVVEPAKQDLLWREGHEVLQSLPLLQEHSQVGAVLEGNLGKQTNLDARRWRERERERKKGGEREGWMWRVGIEMERDGRRGGGRGAIYCHQYMYMYNAVDEHRWLQVCITCSATILMEDS